LGNPGTGKTTVARVMGRIFKELGYLPSDHVVEADRETEAYTLDVRHRVGGEDFGREAIETLLKFMEDNRGRLVVVVAGYDDQMRRFLTSNPGLRSRFTNIINFPDYLTSDCIQMFSGLVRKQKLVLSAEAIANMPAVFDALRSAPNWSNGRDVRTLLEFVSRAQAGRVIASASEPNVFTEADVTAGPGHAGKQGRRRIVSCSSARLERSGQANDERR
jgi:hypothetical protein